MSNRPIVWVIKEQMRRTGVGSEVMDFTPAMAYGELRFILKHDMPMNPGSPMMKDWWDSIDRFADRYDADRDFIIATGKPSDIFMVGWSLGAHLKHPRFLNWQREENRYRVFDTFPELR